MAVSPTNKRNCDYVLDEIHSSGLSAALKEDLAAVLLRTLDATNGLSQAQKLQACTENQFDMMRLFIMQIIRQDRHVSTWKDALVRVRWQVCLALAIIAAMLVYRPELAAMVEYIAGGR